MNGVMTDEERQKHINVISSKVFSDGFGAASEIEHIFCKKVIGYDLKNRSMDFEALVPAGAINRIHVAHGAYICGIMDDCMGLTASCFVNDKKDNPTTADMQFNRLKAVNIGDKIRIHCVVRHIGKRLIIVSSEIYRGEELCAFSTENLALIHKGYFDIGDENESI